MPADPRIAPSRRGGPVRRAGLAGGVLALALSGCTLAPPAAPESPSPSPTPRDFTVVTTERPVSFDPAATVTSAGATVALDVFARLMVVHAGNAELKPDAATDCLYTSAAVYQCELREGLTFSNGHRLTASDVKFSIDRAYRLGVDRTSVRLLNSLQRVEKVDDLTVRFHLTWADSQFGYALATPAASIVDEEVYDPDAVRPDTELPVGSGPFRLEKADDRGLTFVRFPGYQGATAAGLDRVRVAFANDTAAVEQSMTDKTVDAVWRGLDPAAMARLDGELQVADDARTKAGFAKTELPGARMHRLLWNPDSRNVLTAQLRSVVALSLQADRTLTSLIPPQVDGSVASFPAGGRPKIPAASGQRAKLTLGYSTRAPGQGDLARTLRDRLEEKGGLSVQLRPDTDDADLVLTDRPAWVNTAFGWLQPYLDAPLPGSRSKLVKLDQNARETTDAGTRRALLAETQEQAAADMTVLPISLGPETLFVGEGAGVEGDPFGPAWQLGLWSFRRA